MITDEPILAELERLRFENKKLKTLVRREALAEIKRKRAADGGRLMKTSYKYPFPVMAVGQAFFIGSRDLHKTLRAMASYWQRKHQGKKFSVLSHEHEGVKGWRVVRWA